MYLFICLFIEGKVYIYGPEYLIKKSTWPKCKIACHTWPQQFIPTLANSKPIRQRKVWTHNQPRLLNKRTPIFALTWHLSKTCVLHMILHILAQCPDSRGKVQKFKFRINQPSWPTHLRSFGARWGCDEDAHGHMR